MSIASAITTLRTYLDHDIPAFLWGPPGVGKSDAVRQIAAEMGVNMIDFRAILRDPIDLRGLPSTADGIARWLPPSDLPDVKRDGDTGIFFMDELNAAPASVQAACFGLVLDRKVGEYRLPPGWRIIAAGNRQSDRAAAQRMPTALANRFAHIDVSPDINAFVAWANQNGIDPMLVGFLMFRPALLHSMDGEDQRAFPTPRSWSQVSKIAQLPIDAMLPVVEGLVGKGAAAEYLGFMRVVKDLPPLSEVFEKPATARVPDQPSARYAIVSGIARMISHDNFSKAVIYANRLPREFNVMMVHAAVNRDKSLCESKTYVDWVAENSDVIF